MNKLSPQFQYKWDSINVQKIWNEKKLSLQHFIVCKSQIIYTQTHFQNDESDIFIKDMKEWLLRGFPHPFNVDKPMTLRLILKVNVI